MLEFIDLSNWKTKGQIIKELQKQGVKTDERTLRQNIERHNILYCQGVVAEYIVHSSKGYKKTSNKEEILSSINDLQKRALNMLWKVSETKKSMREHDNLKFELEERNLI